MRRFHEDRPVHKAIESYNGLTDNGKIEHTLIHTGQHNDVRMSESNLPDGTIFNGAIPKDREYAVITLHPHSNVDNQEIFEPLVEFLLNEVSVNHTLILWKEGHHPLKNGMERQQKGA